MIIQRAALQDCQNATGSVIVIDVLRAFTTAAYAFDAGAEDIILVSTVEEAFALREKIPGLLLMGEVNGLPIPGFDLSNSPAALIGQNLQNCHLVQRTTSGTQGIVRSTSANTLLASSLVCARATVRFIRNQQPAALTFVITGHRPGGWGDEDAACADYIEELLRGGRPDPELFIQRVRRSLSGGHFTDPEKPEFNSDDLTYSTQIDRFDFAMLIERKDGLLIMDTVR